MRVVQFNSAGCMTNHEWKQKKHIGGTKLTLITDRIDYSFPYLYSLERTRQTTKSNLLTMCTYPIKHYVSPYLRSKVCTRHRSVTCYMILACSVHAVYRISKIIGPYAKRTGRNKAFSLHSSETSCHAHKIYSCIKAQNVGLNIGNIRHTCVTS